MIPLFVECAGKQVVIFGGGEVAARKAGHFAQEAEVLMVSRTFSPSCRALPVHLQTLDTRAATDAELELLIAPAFLVIGALSDRAENDRIGALCREHGVLFNNADGDARRRGHPGHYDRGALHGRDQHGKRGALRSPGSSGRRSRRITRRSMR